MVDEQNLAVADDEDGDGEINCFADVSHLRGGKYQQFPRGATEEFQPCQDNAAVSTTTIPSIISRMPSLRAGNGRRADDKYQKARASSNDEMMAGSHGIHERSARKRSDPETQIMASGRRSWSHAR